MSNAMVLGSNAVVWGSREVQQEVGAVNERAVGYRRCSGEHVSRCLECGGVGNADAGGTGRCEFNGWDTSNTFCCCPDVSASEFHCSGASDCLSVKFRTCFVECVLFILYGSIS